MRDDGGGRDMHVVGDAQMPEHHGPAADGAARADVRATGNAHAAREGGVRADAHVVGDLDEVVELDAVFDHRIEQGATVNAGVGADFHVVTDAYRAEVLDLDPLCAVLRKAKPIRTEHHPGVDEATAAEHATFPHAHAGDEHGVRPNDGPLADCAERANAGRGIDGGGGVDDRARVDARAVIFGTLALHPLPKLGEPGEVQIRLLGNDAVPTLASDVDHIWRDDDAPRLRVFQVAPVAGVGQKAQVRGASQMQRQDASDHPVCITMQFPTQLVYDRPYPQHGTLHKTCPSNPARYPVVLLGAVTCLPAH